MQDPQRTQAQGCAFRKRLDKWLLPTLPVIALVAAAVWSQGHGPAPGKPQASPHTGAAAPAHLADFAGQAPSPDARVLANWVAATDDNKDRAFVIVDKKDARAYVFTPDDRLADSAPVLVGQAHGDEVLPGSGDKSPAEMTPEEKTTPAGRFVAEPGENASKEDVIWVDYDDAISMHRVRPTVASEHRLERLASPAADDNRISFGCINLPVTFYEDVARPMVQKYGAVIYVLPEVKTLQQVFGAYDVTDPTQVAAARQTLADAARHAVQARAPAQG